MPVLGFDLSRYEDNPLDPRKVNFNKAHANEIEFAYFRFANGTLIDSVCDQFVRDCTGVMPWGSFGVVYPGYSIKIQAQNYIALINKLGQGQLPLVVDWEVEGVTWQMVDEYIALLEQAFPNKEIWIYTRNEYLRRMLPNAILYPAKYYRFSRIPIWQAQYANAPDPLPFGFTRVLWQYTERGFAEQFGIEEAKEVDLNIYDGTIEEFNSRFGTVTTPPAPSTPPDDDDDDIPPVVVPTTGAGFYKFSALNYFKRPGGGPLTLPMTRSRGKMGDNGQNLLWASLWKPCIKALNPNNKAAVDLVANPSWGPSKGLSGPYIKWIGLLWPGENLVKIEEVVNGWGRVQGVNSPAEALRSVGKTWLIQEIYDYNKKNGYGHRNKPVYVPIIGGPWWVDMKWLTKL